MERNFRNSQGYMLESQIREAFGKVTYSETCHDKFINRILKLDDRIKVGQIVLSGITTSGFVVTIFSDDKIASIIGAVFSVGLLILNTYTKNFKEAVLDPNSLCLSLALCMKIAYLAYFLQSSRGSLPYFIGKTLQQSFWRSGFNFHCGTEIAGNQRSKIPNLLCIMEVLRAISFH